VYEEAVNPESAKDSGRYRGGHYSPHQKPGRSPVGMAAAIGTNLGLSE
jgi:hypothetical protein